MENPGFKFVDGQHCQKFPSEWILPEDDKPHLSEVSPLTTVPIIDLKEDHFSLVKKISDACEEYGFFLIVNHGVQNELCKSMIEVFAQYFQEVPAEERAKLLTDDKLNRPGRIYRNSVHFNEGKKEKVLLWNETLTHPPFPCDNFPHELPTYPPQYREIASKYITEVRGVFPRLIRLISEGLGLEENRILETMGYKDEELLVLLHAHYCPSCPDPESTLASMIHTDIDVITIIQQREDVVGFHVMKDDKWFSVEPVKNSFLVVLGDQMQVMSNGKYKSRYHRTVANKDKYRTSLAMFCAPNPNSKIGPIQELITEENPALYRNFFHQDAMAEYSKKVGKAIMMEEFFEIKQVKA